MSMSPSRRATRSSAARPVASLASSRTGDAGRSVTVRPATTSMERDASPEDEASSSLPGTTDQAVQSILKARKCWRSIKGKEEAVWPPELEAALIEGLEKYKPAESKSTRVLGRFPMRNKFVADHILEATGVRRTPKQVGSRIQQLRDTNSGKHILKAISDRHYAMMHPKSHEKQEQHDVSLRATSSKTVECPPPRPSSPSTSHVYIQTLPPHAAWHSHTLGSCSPVRADLHSQEPRPLHMVDPTVTFTSPGRSACHSSFRVFHDGHLVHEEVTQVTVSATAQLADSQPFLYTTMLVPGYWAQLCAVEDPASYTILQEVIRIPYSAPPSQDSLPDVLLSVYYHFVDGLLLTPPLSPHSSCGSELDFSTYAAEPSPLMKPLANFGLGLGLHDALDSPPMPGLLHPYEDGYISQPGSPMDIPLVGLSQWGYPAHTGSVLTADLPASCDSYFDPSVIFSPHAF